MTLSGVGMFALASLAVLASGCGGRATTTTTRNVTGSNESTAGAATMPDGSGGNQSPGGAGTTGLEGLAGSESEMDAGVGAPCMTTATGSVAVSGSIRGFKVDAVVRDNGIETYFLGPGASGSSEYSQLFDGIYDAGNAAEQFEVRTPSDAVTAKLSGWASATAAEVGTYPPAGCAYFTFEMRLPIPPGVVCPAKFAPCGPECEPVGELALCSPARPKVRYSARPAATCSSNVPSALGDWRLQLTSVCPHPVADTLVNFETHGHLSATLVNEADASDTVSMSLDF